MSELMQAQVDALVSRLESNGLEPGATVYVPADIALSMMQERGDVKQDVYDYLTSLGTHVVRIKGDEVVAITFDDEEP